jgi:hypothetical protein
MSMIRSHKVLLLLLCVILRKYNGLPIVVMTIIKCEKIEKVIYSRNHDLDDEGKLMNVLLLLEWVSFKS